MSKENSNPILGAIDQINTAFEEFKSTNDKRLEAEEWALGTAAGARIVAEFSGDALLSRTEEILRDLVT